MPIVTGSVQKTGGRDTNLGAHTQFSYLAPIAADTDRVVVAEVPATALGATVELTIAASPDVPRPLTYEVSVDASADLVMKFDTYGTDFWGNSRHETVANVVVGAVSDGKIAFRTVSKCIATTGGAAADAGDRVRVGMDGTRFGLPTMVRDSDDILEAYWDAGVSAWVQLTLVTAGLGTGEYMLDIGQHNGVAYSNIEFGDTADGTNQYAVNLMSTYGIQYSD